MLGLWAFLLAGLSGLQYDPGHELLSLIIERTVGLGLETFEYLALSGLVDVSCASLCVQLNASDSENIFFYVDVAFDRVWPGFAITQGRRV